MSEKQPFASVCRSKQVQEVDLEKVTNDESAKPTTNFFIGEVENNIRHGKQT